MRRVFISKMIPAVLNVDSQWLSPRLADIGQWLISILT